MNANNSNEDGFWKKHWKKLAVGVAFAPGIIGGAKGCDTEASVGKNFGNVSAGAVNEYWNLLGTAQEFAGDVSEGYTETSEELANDQENGEVVPTPKNLSLLDVSGIKFDGKTIDFTNVKWTDANGNPLTFGPNHLWAIECANTSDGTLYEEVTGNTFTRADGADITPGPNAQNGKVNIGVIFREAGEQDKVISYMYGITKK